MRLPENWRRERSDDPIPRFSCLPPPAVRSHPIRLRHRATGQWAGRTTRHGAAPHGHPAPPAFCLKGQCLSGSHSRVRMRPLCERRVGRREGNSAVVPTPIFDFSPLFFLKPSLSLPLNSCLCPRTSDVGGDSTAPPQRLSYSPGRSRGRGGGGLSEVSTA